VDYITIFNIRQRTARILGSIGDGHFNLYTGLDVDGGDLLDDLGGAVEVDHSLVNSHLELVPGLATLSTGSLTGGDPQGLGGHPHGALHLQLLVLGSLDQVAADLLQGLNIAGGQSDPDAMNRCVLLNSSFAILVCRHCGRVSVICFSLGISHQR